MLRANFKKRNSKKFIYKHINKSAHNFNEIDVGPVPYPKKFKAYF